MRIPSHPGSHRHRRQITAGTLLGLLLAWAPWTLAQELADETFSEILEVRLVNLEVVVLDEEGQRVSGLDSEDFRLLIDGREVAIGYFSEVVEGRAAPPVGRRGPEAIPGIRSGRQVGTSYLVFIDDLFTLQRDRNLVLDDLRKELSRLGGQDRMAVVAFDGRRLEVLSGWSDSAADLQAALARAMERPGLGLQTLAGVRNLSADTSRAGLLDYERKLERVARAASASLRGFARAPGRKVMLLLAGPWSYAATRDALTPTAPYEELHDLRRGHRILDPIFETANRVGYTLYPIDVPGPPAPDANAAERGFPARQSVFREDEVHSTFFRLAGKTGGRALLDGWRRNAFDRVMEDTRSYYWLGFTPDWDGDNQSHDVQIELRRPGLEVRHRTELRDLSRSLEISYLVESALLLGGVPGARPLPIQFGEAVKAGFRKLEVPLRIAIPMDAVTMLRRGGRYAADLELRVAVLDEGGNRNELAVLPVKLDGERPPAAGEYAVYETSLQLRRQEHDLVVALYDPASGTILTCLARWTP